jgi:hypothetical protein
MSDSLSLPSSRSMVVVFGLENGGSEDVGYDYAQDYPVFTLPLTVNVLLIYAYSSL